MIYVIGNRFHANTEDGALGVVISRHRTMPRALEAKDKYNRAHKKECACGGGTLCVIGEEKYGKLYPPA